MTKSQTELRIKQYFESVPAPDTHACEETVELVLQAATVCANAAKEQDAKPDVSLAPSFAHLVWFQARMTKGLVWVLQALVVIIALAYSATADDKGAMLGAFGAASAILAGIGIAGIGLGKNQAVTEISYSCHFDYRQVVLARMFTYGFGDAAALGVLIGFGSVLLPDGFGLVALCSVVSFFATGFGCMLVLARYRGDSALVLCAALSGSIAALVGYMASFHFEFLQRTNVIIWLVLAVGAICGIYVCTRAFMARIDAGFDHVSTRTN